MLNKEVQEGDVVIVGTGQAGTFLGGSGSLAAVLLRNGDMWHGHPGQMRHPQGQDDLDAALIEVDKFSGR